MSPQRDREERSTHKRWKPMGSYGTIGLEIVLCMLAGLFLGQWLDGRFGTAPWLSGLGFFFGVAAAGKALHRGWKEMQAETAREEREEGNPAPLRDPGADDDEDDEEALDAPPRRDHPEDSEKP
jgi:F0F1-type ATP synthase assembly protein I